MSTMGDPPGTRWLKERRQKGGDQSQLLQRVNSDQPALGSWQFRLHQIGPDRWDVIGSSPSESTWGAKVNDYAMPLSEALDTIGLYRNFAAKNWK